MTHLARSVVLNGFEQLVREYGVEPERLLADFGLSSEILHAEDHWIATRTVAQLLNAAAEATREPYFGMLLVTRQDATTLGPMGAFLETSTTLAEAIRDYIDHATIHVQGLDWHLHIYGDEAHLSVRFDIAGLSEAEYRQFSDNTLVQAVSVIRTLTGGRCTPLRLEVHHDEPTDSGIYRRICGVPARFNAAVDCVVLRSADLRLEMIKKDREIHATLQRYIAAMARDARADLPTQVRTVIRRLLPAGHCDLATVAACFACDKRTLQRHLQHHQTSYQRLLDEVRFDLAARYLQSSRLTLTQLAQLLGFSDPANFSRAFRSYFGTTPSRYRRERGGRREPTLVHSP